MAPIINTSSEATRGKLIEAGRELFARDGLEGTRVDRLADLAGVNKALISYHFRGKEGLYRAVLEEIFREVAVELESRLGGEVAPKEQLRAWASALGEIMEEKPDFAAIFLREILAGGERLDGGAAESARRSLSLLRSTLTAGHSSGEIRDTDPFLLHLLLLGGIVLAQLSAPYRERLEGPESDRDPSTHLPPSTREMVPFLEDLIQRCYLSQPGSSYAPEDPGEEDDRQPPEGEI